MEFPSELTQLTLFKDLLQAAEGRTECAPSFIFTAGMVAVSAILGRRIGFPSFPDPLFPVQWAVLCGESGGSRKSSALKLVEKIISESDPTVLVEPAFSTPEGLIRMHALPKGREHGGGWIYPEKVEAADDVKAAQSEYESECQSYFNGVDRYRQYSLVEDMLSESSPLEGFRSCFIIDEFKSLLLKAKRDHAAGLFPKLSEFFNSPCLLSNPSSTSPTQAENPHLCFLGAVPRAWLDRNYTIEDIEGGLGRRFIFVCDEPTAPIPLPRPVDPKWIQHVTERLQVSEESVC